MSKRVLFITSRLLWPIDSGRKMSLNYYCKGLHEQYGYDVYLYCFLENGQQYNGEHPNYIKKVYIAKEISRAEQICNLFTKTMTSVAWPIQCSMYYSKENFDAIKQICQDIQPQAVFTEMIRTANYLEAFKNNHIKTIANLDDLLSKRYFRQANSKGTSARIAGIYSSKLPDFINKFLTYSAIKNFFLRFEAKRCAKWEEIFYNSYDFSMFTSPLEKDEINKRMGKNKALTLSVGIDYDYFSRKITGLVKEKNTLSYVGNFKVAANIDTLKMICEKVLPLIKHSFKFYVIGACPDEIQRQYVSEQIIFTGRVDDLAEYVRKTEVFLSPVSYGTGIKTKIVEAMAMGMPVVTNDVGAEGIGAVDGVHYFIRNEFSEIAVSIDELLDDQEKMNFLSQNAQMYSYENFRWEVVYKTFAEAGL